MYARKRYAMLYAWCKRGQNYFLGLFEMKFLQRSGVKERKGESSLKNPTLVLTKYSV